jgi:hypothetical protein
MAENKSHTLYRLSYPGGLVDGGEVNMLILQDCKLVVEMRPVLQIWDDNHIGFVSQSYADEPLAMTCCR